MLIVTIFGSDPLSELRKMQEEIEAEHKAFIERMKALIDEKNAEDEGEALPDEDEVPRAPSEACRLSEPRHLIPWYTSGFE